MIFHQFWMHSGRLLGDPGWILDDFFVILDRSRMTSSDPGWTVDGQKTMLSHWFYQVSDNLGPIFGSTWDHSGTTLGSELDPGIPGNGVLGIREQIPRPPLLAQT